MTIDEMLASIESDSARIMSCSFSSVELPFPITSQEYLNFAEEDLQCQSTRGLVNALSNTKRSLDARIESLLIAFGLHKTAKKSNWRMPKKLEVISGLGILAPRILGKINKMRNLIEHEFHCPSHEQVEDFIDVVALFNESTKIYLNNLPSEAEIGSDVTEMEFVIDIDHSTPKVVVGRLKELHEILPGDPNYGRFIKGYAKILREMYE